MLSRTAFRYTCHRQLLICLGRCQVGISQAACKLTRHIATNSTADEREEVFLEFLQKDDAGIASIVFNRPSAANAIGSRFLSLMNSHLQTIVTGGVFDNITKGGDLETSEVGVNPTRVLIIRSAVPNVFCAGADLKERRLMPTLPLVAHFVSSARDQVQFLSELSVPTIAAIDGVALGGGLELALGCDMRVMSKCSKVGLPETRLAIIPGAGGTQRLSRIVGLAKANELILTGETISGEEAGRIGLANHAVEQNENGDGAYQKALDIARNILKTGPVACKVAKTAISSGLQVDLRTGLQIEDLAYRQILHTADRKEALQAFHEKRTPRYTGE